MAEQIVEKTAEVAETPETSSPPADLDVFEKLYQEATSPTAEEKSPAVEETKAAEKPIKDTPAKEEIPEKSAPAQEEKPFRFEEDRLYPVPGKDGIEYVPYAKFKRWFEAGKGATQLVEKMKTREKELATPIALSESVKDIPSAEHDAMFAEMAAVANKYRQKSGMKPTAQAAVDPLPKEDREFLNQVRQERNEFQNRANYEKALTKSRQDVTTMVEFAKNSLGLEIDDALGHKIMAEQEKYARENGLKLSQVDLIGILTRLVPDHLKAKTMNEMELKGQVSQKRAPVVSPKSIPAPRTPHAGQNKKLMELSQDELASKSSSERDDLLSSHLRETIGR